MQGLRHQIKHATLNLPRIPTPGAVGHTHSYSQKNNIPIHTNFEGCGQSTSKTQISNYILDILNRLHASINTRQRHT